MTDVLAPVLVSYARFLDVRARRHDIVVGLMPPSEALDERHDRVVAVDEAARPIDTLLEVVEGCRSIVGIANRHRDRSLSSGDTPL